MPNGPGGLEARLPAHPVVDSYLNSLGAPSDPASGEVVGRHLNGHLVAGQDADEVHPQLAGNMCQDDVSISDIHMERGIGQGLGDDALQFDHIIFCQA